VYRDTVVDGRTVLVEQQSPKLSVSDYVSAFPSGGIVGRVSIAYRRADIRSWRMLWKNYFDYVRQQL